MFWLNSLMILAAEVDDFPDLGGGQEGVNLCPYIFAIWALVFGVLTIYYFTKTLGALIAKDYDSCWENFKSLMKVIFIAILLPVVLIFALVAFSQWQKSDK